MNNKNAQTHYKSASSYGMDISYKKSNMLVNDPDPNKCNSNNLTINMYRKNKNKLNRLNIFGLH